MRPQKLQLVENESNPSTRMTNENPEQKFITISNMTEMTEYVYEMYMKKLETIKEELPTSVEKQIYSELPKEDEGMEVEPTEIEYEIIDQPPPAKRTAKESSSKKLEPKVFKPTPIVNEITEDDQETEESTQEESLETNSEAKK